MEEYVPVPINEPLDGKIFNTTASRYEVSIENTYDYEITAIEIEEVVKSIGYVEVTFTRSNGDTETLIVSTF